MASPSIGKPQTQSIGVLKKPNVVARDAEPDTWTSTRSSYSSTVNQGSEQRAFGEQQKIKNEKVCRRCQPRRFEAWA